MSAYEKAGESDEWYTPKYIFDAMDMTFDLDVAAPSEGPRYTPTIARRMMRCQKIGLALFG